MTPKVRVEVLVAVVVESDIDPRDTNGNLPGAFKHLTPSPEVDEFLDHLTAGVRAAVTGDGTVNIVEFDLVDDLDPAEGGGV